MAARLQFPKKLLEAADKDKVDFFINKKVKHIHLANAYQKLKKTLMQGDPTQIIFIYGATGVGKTTLCNRLEKDLYNEPDLNLGCIPAARIEAAAPSSGSFDWKEYYRSGLESLGEPLIDRKLDPNTVFEKRKIMKSAVISKRSSISDLRNAFELALYHRGLSAFIVDEAQHLKKVLSGRNLIDQMDTIKSIANRTGVKQVLVGTYELIGLTDLSGQLNRRTTEIHLPRYRYEIDGELDEFIKVLVNLELSMPVKKRPCLSEYIEGIYEGTAGCVGILKDWLTRSLILALNEKDKTVTKAHLDETKIPDRQMSRIAREIREGEMQIYVDKKDEIRSMLGMETNKIIGKKGTLKSGKNRNRPGERIAKRDVVKKGVANA